MPIILTFCAIVIGVAGYVIRHGGGPERSMAAMLLTATAAGLLLEHPSGSNFQEVAVATVMIDLTLFAGMIALAMKANRVWPIWIAGLHATAVATHLIKVLNPDFLTNIYHTAAAISAFPILLILAVGTFRHQARVTRFGIDPAWMDANRLLP